jgi:hypothetical protein
VDRRTRAADGGAAAAATVEPGGRLAGPRAARGGAGRGPAPRGGAAGSVAWTTRRRSRTRGRRSLFARRDPDATQTYAPLPDEDDPAPSR